MTKKYQLGQDDARDASLQINYRPQIAVNLSHDHALVLGLIELIFKASKEKIIYLPMSTFNLLGFKGNRASYFMTDLVDYNLLHRRKFKSKWIYSLERIPDELNIEEETKLVISRGIK